MQITPLARQILMPESEQEARRGLIDDKDLMERIEKLLELETSRQ